MLVRSLYMIVPESEDSLKKSEKENPMPIYLDHPIFCI
jgi:hypothetical protein